jgi:hypothetical protein
MRETMADRCSFRGPSSGPFNKVEGLFTVLMCADCQATRGHASGPYPVMTRSEMRAGLDLLPYLGVGAECGQPPTANRHVIAVMRTRLAAGEQVARMYQEPGLAWRERQAEVAETLVAERRATERHSSRVHPTPIAPCQRWPDRDLRSDWRPPAWGTRRWMRLRAKVVLWLHREPERDGCLGVGACWPSRSSCL